MLMNSPQKHLNSWKWLLNKHRMRVTDQIWLRSSRLGPHSPGLSHHRTCRSAYGGSRKMIKAPIPRKEARESMIHKPANRQCRIHM